LHHRSTQYADAASAGAAALLVVSSAPRNLRQVGSVRRAWEAMGPIPALTIGADDGLLLQSARDGGARLTARVEVRAGVERGAGYNVVGRIRGQTPHQIVLGAHFDTWFAGSSDNGAGVALLLALAARRACREPPRCTLVFVAWDGEELALYGGYDFLRRHREDPILAVIDFETPSACGAQLYGLARSNHRPLVDGLEASGVADLFAAHLPMELVPELFGGVIPTDIQGLYRSGTPAVATAGDAPYYHTVEDTPDKVDLLRLCQLVDAFDRAIDRLCEEPAACFRERDPMLWRLSVELASGDELRLEVVVTDGKGLPQAGAFVEATLLCDHFFAEKVERALTDGRGRVGFAFLPVGGAPRAVHFTAGRDHARVELLLPL
jgi:Zn-dependent M28 family amino/carboxypeptidase